MSRPDLDPGDLIILAGLLTVVIGVAQWSVPAATVVAGVFQVATGLVLVFGSTIKERQRG